jgi:hypothetical protein
MKVKRLKTTVAVLAAAADASLTHADAAMNKQQGAVACMRAVQLQADMC